MRDSVVFYRSFFEAIKEEDDPVKRAQAYDAIFAYALDEEEPEDLKGVGKAAFILAKPQIDANNKRHEIGCKGGAPKGNQNAKKQPKTTKNNQKQPTVDFENNLKQPNENENENENVNVKENVKRKASDEPKHTHGQYKHVRLTDSQYTKLGVDFGEEVRAAAIKRLDEYIQEKPGYKSNDHNLAIRRWVIKALQEDKARGKPNTGMLTHDYDFAALEQQLLGRDITEREVNNDS